MHPCFDRMSHPGTSAWGLLIPGSDNGQINPIGHAGATCLFSSLIHRARTEIRPCNPPFFRLGAIVATSDFLASVPRPAMVQAIKRHATERRPIRDGQPILSAHAYGNTGFCLRTDAERLHTLIRLLREE